MCVCGEGGYTDTQSVPGIYHVLGTFRIVILVNLCSIKTIMPMESPHKTWKHNVCV